MPSAAIKTHELSQSDAENARFVTHLLDSSVEKDPVPMLEKEPPSSISITSNDSISTVKPILPHNTPKQSSHPHYLYPPPSVPFPAVDYSMLPPHLQAGNYLKRVAYSNQGLKGRGQLVCRACTNCKSSHVACENKRPCSRCIRLGKEDTCHDVIPRKRGRPRKDAPLTETEEEPKPKKTTLEPIQRPSPPKDSFKPILPRYGPELMVDSKNAPPYQYSYPYPCPFDMSQFVAFCQQRYPDLNPTEALMFAQTHFYSMTQISPTPLTTSTDLASNKDLGADPLKEIRELFAQVENSTSTPLSHKVSAADYADEFEKALTEISGSCTSTEKGQESPVMIEDVFEFMHDVED